MNNTEGEIDMRLLPLGIYKATKIPYGAKIRLHKVCDSPGREYEQSIDVETGDIYLKRINPNKLVKEYDKCHD